MPHILTSRSRWSRVSSRRANRWARSCGCVSCRQYMSSKASVMVATAEKKNDKQCYSLSGSHKLRSNISNNKTIEFILIYKITSTAFKSIIQSLFLLLIIVIRKNMFHCIFLTVMGECIPSNFDMKSLGRNFQSFWFARNQLTQVYAHETTTSW